eukprot:COSAG02_NODE_6189_length_3742_cov_2.105133_2_plen_92_part_00
MSVSSFAPPFCAQFAQSSAASLPSWPEWPLTFIHRRSAILSVAAWMNRRHTAITVAFLTRRACPGGLGAVQLVLRVLAAAAAAAARKYRGR